MGPERATGSAEATAVDRNPGGDSRQCQPASHPHNRRLDGYVAPNAPPPARASRGHHHRPAARGASPVGKRPSRAPARLHELRADARRPLDDRRGLAGDRKPRDTELLVCLRTRADAVMIGGRHDARRALRAGHRRSRQAGKAARARLGARPADGDRLRAYGSAMGRAAFHRRGRADRDLHRIRRGAARDEHAGRGRSPRGPGRPSPRRWRTYGRSTRSRRSSAKAARCSTASSSRRPAWMRSSSRTRPKLAGGRGPGLADGLDPEVRPLEVVWLACGARDGRAVRPLPGRAEAA